MAFILAKDIKDIFVAFIMDPLSARNNKFIKNLFNKTILSSKTENKLDSQFLLPNNAI